jgi:glycosyltransferase involved in cell wall biosynthesis
MKRYLLITTLDVSRLTNNREHHVLRHIAPRFDETCVVYRKRCEKKGWPAFFRDALVPSAKCERRGAIDFIEVNPMLNHVQGLAMDIAGRYAMEQEGARPRASVRQRIYRLTSSLGILKDLSTVFFLFWYAWRKAPGVFDVCTAMGPWASAAALMLKKAGKVRVCVYEDRDYEPGFIPTPLRKRLAAWMETICLKHSDLRISIGGRLARLRTEQTGLPVATVTTGVALDRFTAPQRDLREPILVYTGNVTFWSGLEMVIAALPAIRQACPSARLMIIGEGLPGYCEQLIRQSRELQLEDAVQFLGRVENDRVADLLTHAHVGVATFQPLDLRRYAFPLKVLEYMAAGLPAIGTADTETEDILVKHDCGVAVDFSAAAFAKAAIHMLHDPLRYRCLADNARRSAEYYRWNNLMEQEYGLLRTAWNGAQG